MQLQEHTYKADNIIPYMHLHTAGPYEVKEREIVTSNESADGPGIIIARIPEWGIGSDLQDASKANGQLLANSDKLLNLCEDLLHQLSTDLDLENVTGAAKYKNFEIRLKETIAAATGQAYEAPQKTINETKTVPVKLEIMRGSDYNTFEDAQKDGAIYDQYFNNMQEVQIAIEGAKLAALCIGDNTSKLQFKTTEKPSSELTVDDVNKELNRHFSKEHPILPNQSAYLVMLNFSHNYSDAIVNINNWSRGLPTTEESRLKLYGNRKFIDFVCEASSYESTYRTEYKDLIKSISKNGSLITEKQSKAYEALCKEEKYHEASNIRNKYILGITVNPDLYKITNPETVKLIELGNKDIYKSKDLSR